MIPPDEHRACLLLGSNIRPEHYLPLAVELIQKHLTVLRASSVWESGAVGSDGPNFLNVALLASTGLGVTQLKQQVLRPIEAQLGRVRTADKNAARSMDIDLILFDGELLDANLWVYAYRAVPVSELLPEYVSTTGEPLERAAQRLVAAGSIRRRADVSLAKQVQ